MQARISSLTSGTVLNMDIELSRDFPYKTNFARKISVRRDLSPYPLTWMEVSSGKTFSEGEAGKAAAGNYACSPGRAAG